MLSAKFFFRVHRDEKRTVVDSLAVTERVYTLYNHVRTNIAGVLSVSPILALLPWTTVNSCCCSAATTVTTATVLTTPPEPLSWSPRDLVLRISLTISLESSLAPASGRIQQAPFSQVGSLRHMPLINNKYYPSTVSHLCPGIVNLNIYLPVFYTRHCR